MILVAEERACLGCGADVSERHYNAKRCVSCAQENNKERQRECDQRPEAKERARQYKARPEVKERTAVRKHNAYVLSKPIRPSRYCADCRTDISERRGSNITRCHACQQIRSREMQHDRQQVRGRTRSEAKRAGKSCLGCGAATSERHSNAVRCCECALKRNRTASTRRMQAARQRRRGGRICSDCGAAICGRGQAVRCIRCQWVRKRERERERAHRPEVRRYVRKKAAARRLRMGGTKPHRYWPQLAERQGGKCGLCGKPLELVGSRVHVDHIIPVSRGGPTVLSNLQATHIPCNLAKGNRITEQQMVAA